MDRDNLKRQLEYNPSTGVFTWLVQKGKAFPGRQAGRLRESGYRSIRVNRKEVYEHRLAWFYTYGEWPPNDIDHINGVRNDNRIENLRCATRSENKQNTKMSRRNKSGVMGVHWDSTSGKWRAKIIKPGGQFKHLGFFKNLGDAAKARKKAEIRYGFHQNHGRPA